MTPQGADPLPAGGLSKRKSILVLAAIVVLATWLRLPGNFYPATVHFDEGMYVSNVLCGFPPTGTYYHPFLSRYLLTVAEALPCVRTWMRGSPHPARETQAAYASNPAPFLVLGRSISLLCALTTVVLTYVLASALGGTGMGLAAALLVAISPTDIIVSNSLGPWCLATLLTTVVFLFINGVGGASRRGLLALGGATGLAIAVVYTMGLLALPILVALAMRWRQRQLAGQPTQWPADVLAVAAGAVIGQVLGNFTALVQPKLVLHEMFMPEASLLSDQSANFHYWNNLKWYVGSLFGHQGLGWAIATCGIVGLLLAVRRSRGLWLPILTFTAAILVIQPAAVLLFANRYTTPATPLLAMAAAWLLFEVGQRIAEKAHIEKFQPAWLLVVLVALPGLRTDIAYRQALNLMPTRELARNWIEENIPSGSSVVQSNPFVTPILLDCELLTKLTDKDDKRPCYHISIAPVDPEHFADAFLTYAASSDASYLIYTATTPPGTLRRIGRSLTIGASLRARYPLLARFQYPGLDDFADDTVTVDPAVEIFRLKN
jgi:hypothetical protein